MIGPGVTYMLVGMGAVFLLLGLLVAATTLMSRTVIFVSSRPRSLDAEPEEIAAITAAIAQHRRRGGRKTP